MRRLLLVAALLASPAALRAQGELIPRPCIRECPPGARCRPRPCPDPVPRAAVERVSSDVRAELADGVLRYEVTEVFVNRGGGIEEADYLFPLPRNAAFEDLRLSINGELVSGEALDANEARRIYEEIVRRQKDPALVEWMGSGLLRTRVFPIQPGERRTVVVRFNVVAEREGDALRVDYRRGVRQPQPDRLRASIRSPEERPRARFSLYYRPDARFGAPYSPTSALDVTDSAGRRRVRVREGAGDVTILLPVRRGNAAAVSLLAHAPDDEPGYALVTLVPPARRAAPLPRDVTFVVDVSGSMRGQKIVQAREAGKQLLSSLEARDRFRIIAFSDGVETFREGFVPASEENLRAARRYLDELRAEGSTNISGALAEALDHGDDDTRFVPERDNETDEANPVRRGGRLPLVLFVTDGEPTVGDRDPESIAATAARTRGRARVFTFGLGADVNAALVERLALEGRGTAQFVRPEESVERAVSLVASRLTQPVVTDLTVRADGVRLTRTLPSGPVDVFSGQDVVLLTRYEGSGQAELVFSGRTADGPVRWTQTVRFPERERRNPFVARLWATQRLGWLSAERRRNGGSPETDEEIRRLGMRFGIPTELTSYFVKEPGMDIVAQTRRGAIGGATGNALAPIAVAPEARRERAFDAAKTAAAQRSAVTISAADQAAVAEGHATALETRRAGNRRFTLRDRVWTDDALADSLRLVRVKPYSDAYFALLARVPELSEPFALGERVKVAGRRVAVELAADGMERMTDAALADFAANW